jgi:hypothetical protein
MHAARPGSQTLPSPCTLQTPPDVLQGIVLFLGSIIFLVGNPGLTPHTETALRRAEAAGARGRARPADPAGVVAAACGPGCVSRGL